MKNKICIILLVAVTLLAGGVANACVGRIIQIGAIDSPAGRGMAEILALLVNERTGTTVKIRYFEKASILYDAVKVGEIGLLVEDTTQALEILDRPLLQDSTVAYDQAKDLYREKFNMVWLVPFKFVNALDDGGSSQSAILISSDVLSDFPGLPRLLKKLAKKIESADYTALVAEIAQGAKARDSASQLLNNKKLI